MTTIKAIRLASLVTAINVLVASGFSIAAIIRPQYLVPAESVPTEASLLLAMYAAARTIPLALFALGAIYKQATPALLILGALAGAMQLLDAGVGLFEHDLGKCAGPLFISPSSNSSWCICFTDPCGSRRKPSADKRTLRPALPSSLQLPNVKPIQQRSDELRPASEQVRQHSFQGAAHNVSAKADVTARKRGRNNQ
jgi:hypothetical protein